MASSPRGTDGAASAREAGLAPLATARSSSQAESPSRLQLQFLIFAFGLLVYIPATGYDFVVDDWILIVHNPFVRTANYLKEIFTQGFWSSQGIEGTIGFYRPLVQLTFLAERCVFGLRAAAFHLVNVLVHATVMVLVYRLGARLWRRSKGMAWAALLFGVHPLRVENVAPVFGIGDLISALFLLLALIVYTRPLDEQAGFPRSRAWSSAGLFGLAVLAKEAALLLPVLLIAYEHICRLKRPGSLVNAISRYGPTLLVAGAYLALRWVVFEGGFAPRTRPGLGLEGVALSALSLTGQYAHKLVWPASLTFFQSFAVPSNWWDPFVLLGAASLLLCGASFILLAKRAPAASFAALWFPVMLAPALDARVLSVSAYGERYLYLPSVSLAWLAGAGLARLGERSRGRWPELALGSVVLLAFTARTLVRLPDWKNDFVLATATVRAVPEAGPYHVYLGNAHRHQGRRDQARQAYVRALALGPYLPEAYVNLAGVLADDGHVEGARAMLRMGATATPHFAPLYYAWATLELAQRNREFARRLYGEALKRNPHMPEALNNLGLLVWEEGRREEAQALFRRALRADPDYADAHSNLGMTLAQAFEEAERHLRRAIELDPRHEAAYLNLAGLYEERGDFPAAFEIYRAASQALPDSANVHFRLGILARKLHLNEDAIRSLRKAAQLQPQSALARAELARAYWMAGDRERARQVLEEAGTLGPHDPSVKDVLDELERMFNRTERH